MTPSTVIERVIGRAVTIRGADIDTDRIMPARFLKAVSFEGLEQHLFADDRAAAAVSGIVHTLDAPGAADARVLLANANFGCGSSREHAPQALFRWGFRAIIAESFAEIFAGNAMAIGLVCVRASTDAVAALMACVEGTPDVSVTVDLRSETAELAGHGTWPIALPTTSKQAFLSGDWDATGWLLDDYFEVERVEARLPYLRTTSRKA